MADTRKTESLHVVPQSRVDQAMQELAGIQKLTTLELRRIRGILYCETFMTERTTIIADEETRHE